MDDEEGLTEEDFIVELGRVPEWLAGEVLQPLQPGEFNITMVAEKLDICHQSANRLLRRLEREGKLVFAGDRLHNGRKCKAYREAS